MKTSSITQRWALSIQKWLMLVPVLFLSHNLGAQETDKPIKIASGIRCAKVSSDGNTCYVSLVSDAPCVGEYSIGTGKLLRQFPADRGQHRAIAVENSGKLLAYSIWSKEPSFLGIRLWDLKNNKKRFDINVGDVVTFVAFSPSGGALACADADGVIRIWNCESGREQAELRGHTSSAYLAFSTNGKMLASAGEDGRVIIWNIQTKKQILSVQRPRTCFLAVAFSRDEKSVIAGGQDGTVHFWEVNSKQHKSLTLSEAHTPLTALAFSNSLDRLASGDNDSRVRTWDLTNGKLLQQLPVRDLSVIKFVDFTKTDARLFSASVLSLEEDTTEIRIWSLQAKQK
jgi:WD40 repeat protein